MLRPLSSFTYLKLKFFFSIYCLSTALLQPKGNSEIISHMAKLVDSITVSVARLVVTRNCLDGCFLMLNCSIKQSHWVFLSGSNGQSKHPLVIRRIL